MSQGGPTISQLRRLLAAREEDAKAQAWAKKTKAKKEAAEAEVQEAMTASPHFRSGAHKIDVGEPFGIVSFQANQTDYARVYDEEAFAAWAESKGFGETLLKHEPAPRKAALNQFVRRVLKSGGDIAMPAGVEPAHTPYVTVKLPK